MCYLKLNQIKSENLESKVTCYENSLGLWPALSLQTTTSSYNLKAIGGEKYLTLCFEFQQLLEESAYNRRHLHLTPKALTPPPFRQCMRSFYLNKLKKVPKCKGERIKREKM